MQRTATWHCIFVFATSHWNGGAKGSDCLISAGSTLTTARGTDSLLQHHQEIHSFPLLEVLGIGLVITHPFSREPPDVWAIVVVNDLHHRCPIPPNGQSHIHGHVLLLHNRKAGVLNLLLEPGNFVGAVQVCVQEKPPWAQDAVHLGIEAGNIWVAMRALHVQHQVDAVCIKGQIHRIAFLEFQALYVGKPRPRQLKILGAKIKGTVPQRLAGRSHVVGAAPSSATNLNHAFPFHIHIPGDVVIHLKAICLIRMPIGCDHGSDPLQIGVLVVHIRVPKPHIHHFRGKLPFTDALIIRNSHYFVPPI
mmetsp:Transcript_58363/g.96746  ORF Transcript_58363/g.96746 Transcript_58363/m.96746 type:complete len:306 (-) Transcript_58363:186-1103(-)